MVNPINKTAGFVFVFRFHGELARLKTTGINITKTPCRLFSFAHDGIHRRLKNNQIFTVRDKSNSRWQFSAIHISSVYEQIAADIVENPKIKIGGVSRTGTI